MIFADVSVEAAEGLILAHSVQTPERKIAKGAVLAPADIADLIDAGILQVSAVRLELDDLDENAAAETVARSISGVGLEVSPPYRGRCNIYARKHGLCEFDPSMIDRLNQAATGVLISTLSPFDSVGPGRMVATVKVIPYAVKAVDVELLCSCATTLSVREFRPHRVGLIVTESNDTQKKRVSKTISNIAARLETCGSQLHRCEYVPHEQAQVTMAIGFLIEQGAELVLILGVASASDRNDVVPSAIEAAAQKVGGGGVDLFGIPVDPGNLLITGDIGGVSAIGLPGCARSSKLNGIDLVLPRVLAGSDISATALLGLGVGGLLSDISERPQPREDYPKQRLNISEVIVSAVVLAGGMSRRMGVPNKLLAEVNGVVLVRQVTENFCHAATCCVTVVTGFEAERIRAAVEGLDVTLVHNPNFMEGLSASVKAGVRTVPDRVHGVLIALGDMPMVDTAIINQLITTFMEHGGHAICVPVYHGRRGNPVLWPREFFSNILDLTGDIGARQVLDRYPERIVEVPIENSGVIMDVDTPEELARFLQHSE